MALPSVYQFFISWCSRSHLELMICVQSQSKSSPGWRIGGWWVMLDTPLMRANQHLTSLTYSAFERLLLSPGSSLKESGSDLVRLQL